VDYDLALVNGAGAADGNIPHGRLLAGFAEAVVTDAAALPGLRARLVEAMGGAALVDAAAVVALFNAIDRVADATGIPLEDWKAEDTADMRAALGVDRFPSTRGD
jgi:hypothetical protein